jgi:hypothetical protein
MLKNTLKLGQTCLAMALCLSVASCNKEEFYEKAYLQENPGPGMEVGGSVGGADQGSPQGGVNGGTTGGSTGGSTTGGSATGSSAGGTVGGSSTGGSSTGSSAGGTTGGVVYKDAEEMFQQNAAQSKKLDIVWVIDNSGSMADEQDELGANFNVFINDFITKNADFKMGITTTDCSSTDKCGKIVSGSDTKLTSAKAAENKNQFLSDFNTLVQVGIYGSGSERGLQASNGFMSKYAASFIRPDAYLAVVILSDEEDQSSGAVDQYTDMLKGYKANAGLVKVYSIVDVNKTNSGKGITTGGDRYIDASAKTAGVSADIREDFASVLSAMGDEILNLLGSFALAADPIPGSLKVYVNNQLVSNYSFDAASRSIKFDPNSLPQAGANIKVTYKKL